MVAGAHEVSGSQPGGDGNWAGRGFSHEWTDLPDEDIGLRYILEEPDPEIAWQASYVTKPCQIYDGHGSFL